MTNDKLEPCCSKCGSPIEYRGKNCYKIDSDFYILFEYQCTNPNCAERYEYPIKG